ncbi:MAG: diguanylate cyclase with sensor [Anaerosolibacter sp.]|jgi:diguanylate cyclase (GGDEF)-like protein|uniref:sensor domain-containing diguanylate cyclase n=1 Tax=Anaerosolibacter sp. TaxID=1872527 RepID=UPI002638B7A6|nr:sensor domain-containing diguanylate cyclase [Anaerosolibacter sp.]MDF2546581.1 diguanylate cyclase with sensor [Anaerosolibacter sp.]
MKKEFGYGAYFKFFMLITFAIVLGLNLVNIRDWSLGIVGTLLPIWILLNYMLGVKEMPRGSRMNRAWIKIIGNFILFSILLYYIGGYTNLSYTLFHFFIILSSTVLLSPYAGLLMLGLSFVIALKVVFSQAYVLDNFIIHSYAYGGAMVIGYFIRMEKTQKSKLDHKVRELDALYKISKMIDYFPGTEEILDKISVIVGETIDAAMCLIMLYDEEQERLTAKAGYGLSKEVINNFTLRKSEGIEGEVIENRGQITCKDIGNLAIYQRLFDGKLETVTVIPLYLRNKVIGTLSIYDTKDKHYSSEDIDLLDMMGSRIGMILENDKLYQQIHTKAIMDGLTGLYNHKQFYDRLKQEILDAKRTGYQLYLLMIDIDRFKAFNDQYGHVVGDQVLVQIAETIKGSIRETDYAARYGGEEFAVILPNADHETASKVADRIRGNVKKTTNMIDQLRGEDVDITVSIGISCYPDCSNDIVNLVDIADVRMYKGKAMGGDKIIA